MTTSIFEPLSKYYIDPLFRRKKEIAMTVLCWSSFVWDSPKSYSVHQHKTKVTWLNTLLNNAMIQIQAHSSSLWQISLKKRGQVDIPSYFLFIHFTICNITAYNFSPTTTKFSQQMVCVLLWCYWPQNIKNNTTQINQKHFNRRINVKSFIKL